MTISELILEIESPRLSLLAATSPKSIYRKWKDAVLYLKVLEASFPGACVMTLDGKPANIDVTNPEFEIRVEMTQPLTLTLGGRVSDGFPSLETMAAATEIGLDEEDLGVTAV